MSNFRDQAFEEVGDTVDLGGLIFTKHYTSMIDNWVKKIGRPSRKGEEIPLVLSAFMYAIMDCQVLAAQYKIGELRPHTHQAYREANDAIGVPVLVSTCHRTNWN